jgi:uncharacterized protein (TIGR00645 family)
MGRVFNRIFAAVPVASRWVMAPLCLGLIGALVILVVQFCRELAHTVTGFAELRDAEVILAVLKLVDLVLVANLVVMIIEAGIAIFVPPHAFPNEAAAPASGTAGFAALKPKLFASISAIAAIDLLESFVNIGSVDKAAVTREIAILLTFVAAGVLLAWMDRLAERH